MGELDELKIQNSALLEEIEQLRAENEELRVDQWRLMNLLNDENTPCPWDLDCKTNVFKWSPSKAPDFREVHQLFSGLTLQPSPES